MEFEQTGSYFAMFLDNTIKVLKIEEEGQIENLI